MWIDGNREKELYLKGEELYNYPSIPIRFAGIVSDTHHLGSFGWRLTMRQRTPLHVAKTRPYIALSPSDKWDFGFRFRLRARTPYKNEMEVFEDMRMFSGSIVKFSMSKFETKEVPVIDRDLVKLAEGYKAEVEDWRKTASQLQIQKQDLQAHLVRLEGHLADLERENGSLRTELDRLELDRVVADDPFEALRVWNEERIGQMDFSTPVPPHEPVSNVIDLVELLRQRQSADMDEDLEERVMTVLGTA